jgi:hypothetical protein
MVIGGLAMFSWAMAQPDHSLEQSRAVLLTTLVMFQAFHLGNSRSERRSVLQVPVLSNRFLFAAQAGSDRGARRGAAPARHPGGAARGALRAAAWWRLVAVAATVLLVVEAGQADPPPHAPPRAVASGRRSTCSAAAAGPDARPAEGIATVASNPLMTAKGPSVDAAIRVLSPVVVASGGAAARRAAAVRAAAGIGVGAGWAAPRDRRGVPAALRQRLPRHRGLGARGQHPVHGRPRDRRGSPGRHVCPTGGGAARSDGVVHRPVPRGGLRRAAAGGGPGSLRRRARGQRARRGDQFAGRDRRGRGPRPGRVRPA